MDIYICQCDEYINFIYNEKAYARRVYKDSRIGLKYFNYKKDRYYLASKNIPDQAVVYKVVTTFLGADKSSEFYFFDVKTAKNFLAKLENGEIKAVLVKNFENSSNLRRGFSFNELRYFNPNAEITEL